MPCPPPPPLGKRTDPDLLLTDVLPQPFRMIQEELYLIVDGACDIGWKNQQEEIERSRQPSTTAERTIGPMTEPSIDASAAPAEDGDEPPAPPIMGEVALMADFGNCPRPFYARPNGDVIEVAEDSTIAVLPRPTELPEIETAKWVAATCSYGLELVAMLSSNDFLFLWQRALPEPEPLMQTQSSLGEGGAEEHRREVPKLELRAALKVPAVDGQQPFRKCVLSRDGTIVSLVNDKVVTCYTNPVPVGPPGDAPPAEPPPLISGDLGGRLCVALSPDQDIKKSETGEEVPGLLPEVFLLPRPVASRLSSTEFESKVSFAVVVWLGTHLFERYSLLPSLPGEVPLEGEEASGEQAPFIRRWMQTGAITACAVSPNLSLLAASLQDGCTVLWDLSSGMTKFVLQRHIGAVQHVAVTQTHAVTVGADDRMLRSYDIETGELIIEIEAPRCGIRYLTALQETPLVLAVTSWGLKLIDLDSGSIFADISTTDPEVVPDLQAPQVAFCELQLHVMAHRPADPLPVVEEVEDPKAKKGKESPEPGGAPEEPEEVLWRVPLRLELQRIVSAHQEEQQSLSFTQMSNGEGGAPDITQALSAAPASPDFGTTRGSLRSVNSATQLTKAHSRQTTAQGAEKYLEHEVSPCCLPNPEQFDLINRVREYAGSRHGERRLREIRMKKRLGSMLESMKSTEE